LMPVGVLVSSVVLVLLILIRGLEPALLVASLCAPSWTEDVLDHLSRLEALDGLLFGGFIGVGDRRSQYVLNYRTGESFDEEFDGLRICKIVACYVHEAFEIIGVLVDFWPFQAQRL